MALDSTDPIPEGMLSLYEAYERLLGRALDRPEIAFDFDDEDIGLLNQAMQTERSRADPDVWDSELERYERRAKEANLLIRKELNRGRLQGWINNLKTGQKLRLAAEGWTGSWYEAGYVPSGIWAPYIDNSMYDLPGPQGSVLNGKSRPILLELDDFDAWLSSFLEAPKKKRTGRPKGVGSLERADEPLVAEMKSLLCATEARSPMQAAGMVLPRAAGEGTPESKIRRLVRRYYDRWPRN